MKQFRTRKERIERILILPYGWYLILWQVWGNTIWYDLRLFFCAWKITRVSTSQDRVPNAEALVAFEFASREVRMLPDAPVSFGLKMLVDVGRCWSVVHGEVTHCPLFPGHCQWQHLGERRGARMALWSRYGTPFQSDAFEFKGGKRFRHQHRWTDTSTASHQ